MAEIVDARDEDGDIQLVSLKRYVSDIRDPFESEEQPLIAVIPIEGTLVPGDSIQGSAGSDTVVEQLERADEADAVAIVLRINSGGGSVFASEVIRAKVDSIAADGVPIVVLWAVPPHRAVTGLRQLQMRSGRCHRRLQAALVSSRRFPPLKVCSITLVPRSTVLAQQRWRAV